MRTLMEGQLFGLDCYRVYAINTELDQLLDYVGLDHAKAAMCAFMFLRIEDLVEDDGESLDAINHHIMISTEPVATGRGLMINGLHGDQVEKTAHLNITREKWDFLLSIAKSRLGSRAQSGGRAMALSLEPANADATFDAQVGDYLGNGDDDDKEDYNGGDGDSNGDDEDVCDADEEEDDDSEPSKSCTNSEHSVWFPTVPRVRRLSQGFYRDGSRKDGYASRCKQCRQYQANKMKRMKCDPGPTNSAPKVSLRKKKKSRAKAIRSRKRIPLVAESPAAPRALVDAWNLLCALSDAELLQRRSKFAPKLLGLDHNLASVVERVMGHRVSSDGKLEFLVCWPGSVYLKQSKQQWVSASLGSLFIPVLREYCQQTKM